MKTNFLSAVGLWKRFKVNFRIHVGCNVGITIMPPLLPPHCYLFKNTAWHVWIKKMACKKSIYIDQIHTSIELSILTQRYLKLWRLIWKFYLWHSEASRTEFLVILTFSLIFKRYETYLIPNSRIVDYAFIFLHAKIHIELNFYTQF